MRTTLRSVSRRAAAWVSQWGKRAQHSGPTVETFASIHDCRCAAISRPRRCFGLQSAGSPYHSFSRAIASTLPQILTPAQARSRGLDERDFVTAAGEEGKEKDARTDDAEDVGEAAEEEVEDGEDDKYSELLEQVKAKEEEAAEFKDRALRAMAELENLRERTRRELEQGKLFAVQSIVKDLLDVCDNLERALTAVTIPGEGEEVDGSAVAALKSLHEGVEMTEQQLQGVMRRVGVERFDPQPGDEFDPNIHSALFEVPAQSVGDGAKAGSIGVVTKVGYKMHDRVIRPAEVGVVKAD
mmetsp:Transcript_3243/g.11754  ORF Transcript_3243/g.11754 Transcript_3243/m.11754 type:complete len:298 (-) Transcript_3243:158-1051(-)